MKNIVITGCSSGLGLLMAKHLAKEGHTVYATMRNVTSGNLLAAEALRAWTVENKVDIFIMELDVTSSASVGNAIDEIGAHSVGKIDVLINNAGRGTFGLVEEFSDDQINDMFETMVFGPNRVIKAVLPYMHKQHSGLLLLISSRMSSFQLPFSGAYSAAKAAVHALAKAYHYELKNTGIDSVILQSGSFKTEMAKKSLIAEDKEIARNYGEWYTKVKRNVLNIFSSYQTAQKSSLVTEIVSKIISMPPGQRNPVYPIGVANLESQLTQINDISGDISDKMMAKMEI